MSRRHIESHFGGYIIGSGSRSELVQTDWDYPSTAMSLGWNMRRVQRRPDRIAKLSPLCTCGETVTLKRAPNRGHGCAHRSTDGTVNCKECGVSASEFIAAAGEYLDSLT